MTLRTSTEWQWKAVALCLQLARGELCEHFGSEDWTLRERQSSSSGRNSTSAAIRNVRVLTVLVSEAACSACRTCQLMVREPVEEQKGLSSFLELHCANSECAELVLFAVHTSSRAAPGDLANGVSGSLEYQSEELPRQLCCECEGSGGDTRDWRQAPTAATFLCYSWLADAIDFKNFTAIGQKSLCRGHDSCRKPGESARVLTKETVGGSDVGVLFDSTCSQQPAQRPRERRRGSVTWQACHGPVCEKNIDCFSNAIEKEAAMRILTRTPLNDLRLHCALPRL